MIEVTKVAISKKLELSGAYLEYLGRGASPILRTFKPDTKSQPNEPLDSFWQAAHKVVQLGIDIAKLGDLWDHQFCPDAVEGTQLSYLRVREEDKSGLKFITIKLINYPSEDCYTIFNRCEADCFELSRNI